MTCKRTAPPDPFAALAATLQGVPRKLELSAEDKIRESIDVLRSSDSIACRDVADKLAQRLVEGGSLEVLLGLKVGRGRAFDAVHRRSHMDRRDELLRDLAAELPGRREAKAAELARMLKSHHPKTAIFHQLPVRPPSSVSRLKTILRGGV